MGLGAETKRGAEISSKVVSGAREPLDSDVQLGSAAMPDSGASKQALRREGIAMIEPHKLTRARTGGQGFIDALALGMQGKAHSNGELREKSKLDIGTRYHPAVDDIQITHHKEGLFVIQLPSRLAKRINGLALVDTEGKKIEHSSERNEAGEILISGPKSLTKGSKLVMEFKSHKRMHYVLPREIISIKPTTQGNNPPQQAPAK